MNTLSDKTRVSLGIAVIAIGGGSMWLTNLASALSQVRSEVAELKVEQKADKAVLYQMAADIAVIKTLLEKQRGK